MSVIRTLHWCFKIGQRKKSMYFYLDLLGMKVLRHEEFDRGCSATCNGPYDNKWSKTMVGYGPEDSNFVFELTYNYPIQKYTLGNDLNHVVIESTKALESVKASDWPHKDIGDGLTEVLDPDGYKLLLKKGSEKVQKLSINVSDLTKSLSYWVDVLGMKMYGKDEKKALLGYGDDHCKLELVDIGKPIDHATGFGRIAFAAPQTQLETLNQKIKKLDLGILHPMVDLGTPGKATVTVVILLDPNGYEICFVGDENYTKLCTVDPDAAEKLKKSLDEDKSDAWYERKGKEKTKA